MLFVNPASRNGLGIVAELLDMNPAGQKDGGNLVIVENRVIQKPSIIACSVSMTKYRNNVNLVILFGIGWI